MGDTKDVSMVDIQSSANTIPSAPPRRKSTLILTDDIDMDQMNLDREPQQSAQPQAPSTPAPTTNVGVTGTNQSNNDGDQASKLEPPVTIPVDITWVQGGEKVYVTGSFTDWRKMIGLVRQPDGKFMVTLGLPVGTHRFRFVVDNELRYSDYLPTATDQMGNFVNYIEVTQDHVYSHLAQEQPAEEPSQPDPTERRPSVSTISRGMSSTWGLTNDDDDMGNGFSRYHDGDTCSEVAGANRKRSYIRDIPPIFYDPKVMEQYYVAIDKQSKSQNGSQQAWLHPPQLPPHLEHVILNQFNQNDHDNNSGALPIPNHVVLNHLATTSIKHNTLAVASVVRYEQKYVTQVLYAPLQT